jgi:NADH:ubiquinone oxidoreductase subunit H
MKKILKRRKRMNKKNFMNDVELHRKFSIRFWSISIPIIIIYFLVSLTFFGMVQPTNTDYIAVAMFFILLCKVIMTTTFLKRSGEAQRRYVLDYNFIMGWKYFIKIALIATIVCFLGYSPAITVVIIGFPIGLIISIVIMLDTTI